jgi:hypothetical protein
MSIVGLSHFFTSELLISMVLGLGVILAGGSLGFLGIYKKNINLNFFLIPMNNYYFICNYWLSI